MGHHHPHAHASGGARNRSRLVVTLVLVCIYMVAEIIGGLMTNSLALLADAGHMFSDAGSLALSLFAIHIAQRPADLKRTYGYYRAEILAALMNAATLIAISIVIFVEAIERFQSQPEVRGGLMLWVAAGGLVINLIGLWYLSAGRKDSLNIRGAWLHVLTDTLGSFQAIVAGALIWAFGWNWIDPIASLLIAVLVLYSSWSLLKEATGVLMESVPDNIDVEAVRASIKAVSGVQDVCDLHIWTITSGMISLSAHVGIDTVCSHGSLIKTINDTVHEFGIDHITIQLEGEDFKCRKLPV